MLGIYLGPTSGGGTHLHKMAKKGFIWADWMESRPLPPNLVGTLKDGYLRKVPLPQVPRGQSIIPVACTVTFPVNPYDTNYLQDP
jgi:hypothetical protein